MWGESSPYRGSGVGVGDSGGLEPFLYVHPDGHTLANMRSVPVIVDRLTGEEREPRIFVAIMGASNFTYASIRRVAGFATCSGSAGHAGATANAQPKTKVRKMLDTSTTSLTSQARTRRSLGASPSASGSLMGVEIEAEGP